MPKVAEAKTASISLAVWFLEQLLRPLHLQVLPFRPRASICFLHNPVPLRAQLEE